MGPHKPLNVFLFNVTLERSSLASHFVLLEGDVVQGHHSGGLKSSLDLQFSGQSRQFSVDGMNSNHCVMYCVVAKLPCVVR